jgi:multiple sugar transport system substrate-binding protein
MNNEALNSETPKSPESTFSRRTFLKTASAGVAAASLGPLVTACGSSQSANSSGAFNWTKFKGTTISLLMDKHPYTDAMIADIDSFKQLTGMNIKYDVYPEDVYFEKVTAALSSRSSTYDVLMTGAYQTWVYGPAGWIVDLKPYMSDPNKVAPDWDVSDIYSNLLASDSWSGSPGEATGSGNAHQWAMPWGFEQYILAYNKQVFDQYKLKVPTNLPELVDTATYISNHVPGMYGIAVRGSRSWATIHPGYLSAFTNYGGKDFSKQLKSTVNSSTAAEMTNMWVKMVKQGGPPNWTQYTWYECGSDLGAGKAAMMFDADNLTFSQAQGTKAAGNIAAAAFTPNPNASSPTSNVWIWSLAMSAFSNNKDAAWYFIQWATSKKHLLYAAVQQNQVDPIRKSIWSNADFQNKVKTKGPINYLEAFQATQPGARIYFTPEPLFFQVTTDWATTLQTLYAGSNSMSATQDALGQLASSINNQTAQAGIS